MDERILLHVSTEPDNDFVTLQTYSRKSGRSRRFLAIIDEETKSKLFSNRRVIQKDLGSYTEFFIARAPRRGNVLYITFSWLEEKYDGSLTGRKERVEVNADVFFDFVSNKEKVTVSLLSLKKENKPHINFKSGHNLAAVSSDKKIRKKLGKFLSENFAWQGAESITIYDDYMPYSFFFQENRADGRSGVCGGIIFHQDDLPSKSCYSLHT